MFSSFLQNCAKRVLLCVSVYIHLFVRLQVVGKVFTRKQVKQLDVIDFSAVTFLLPIVYSSSI